MTQDRQFIVIGGGPAGITFSRKLHKLRPDARVTVFQPEAHSMVYCARIRFIGNAASLGAKLALLSAEERRDAVRIADCVEHVDLPLDPMFQIEFAEAMIFPGNSPEDVCDDPYAKEENHAM